MADNSVGVQLYGLYGLFELYGLFGLYGLFELYGSGRLDSLGNTWRVESEEIS